ncbi:RING-H2 finger protein ATL33-like [Punica granatum]|uniref:RING-type domain-containing protein n=2 Tax=Punica granatum TaxID=22663 RepID=A0A218XBJ4_PUNGR|nr:RING-H2 finger protein ATL33-like [Punica granatum]OWM82317.1 hypothetical protein CDL15_Pgr001891 [Punica granatum]PKI62094.1 hypothetical protein CRG98_017467 [Punica granatum]
MACAPIGPHNPPTLPPFPPASHSFILSPLGLVLSFIAVIPIPVVLCFFVFVINRPRVPALGRSRRRFSGESRGVEAPAAAAIVKLRKEADAECPVCLSAFAEGEEVKQLSACDHYFHAPCIDTWLSSHANCPVCRASVALKRPPPPLPRSNTAAARDPDHLQGLPDASSLV